MSWNTRSRAALQSAAFVSYDEFLILLFRYHNLPEFCVSSLTSYAVIIWVIVLLLNTGHMLDSRKLINFYKTSMNCNLIFESTTKIHHALLITFCYHICIYSGWNLHNNIFILLRKVLSILWIQSWDWSQMKGQITN